MARITGNFVFTKNFENLNSYPLDARSITQNYSDLNDGVSIPYPYSGMLVTVYADSASTSNNGTYVCTTPVRVVNNDKLYSQGSTWTKIGGSSLTGGTYVQSARTLSFSGANNNGFTVDGDLFDGYGLKQFVLDPTTLILSAITRNDEKITVNLTPVNVLFNYVTGGTYDISAGTITFRSVSGTPFPVSGFTTGLTTTTGATYYPSQGVIEFTKTGAAPAYSATGFTYVNNITVSSTTNAISGFTNISGTTPVFGGIITAVTGGTYNNGNLYLSGTGLISTGVTVTGFSTSVSSGGGIYTGGTSTAGTGATTAITATSILSAETSGYTIDLSGALKFTNSNSTTRTVGGIPSGSTFFQSGKTIQQILQEIFYPVDAPAITNASFSLTNNAGSYRIIGNVINVDFTATYTSGTSVASGQATVRTGAMSAFTYGGELINTNPQYTFSNTDSEPISNYTVSAGSNQWSCVFVYNVGGTPVDTAGNPYTSYQTLQFTSPSPSTAYTSFEGVYPISATSVDVSYYTQQPLTSSSDTSVDIPLKIQNNNPYKQRFIIPQLMGNVVSIYEPDPQGNYPTINFISKYSQTTGNFYVNSNQTSVPYYIYEYTGTTRGDITIRVIIN